MSLQRVPTTKTTAQAHGDVCQFKVTYASWSVAMKVARRMNHRNRDLTDVRYAHPYECKLCGRVHIGGFVKSATARRRADDEIDRHALSRVRTIGDVIEYLLDA